MIFSAEMDNAKKYGYKFEILWGYKFKPKNIFKGYVDCFYQLRLKYPKTHPLNLVAKLLLNSLSGRFGMEDSFAEITIIKKEYFQKFEDQYSEDIYERIDFDDHILVKHRSNKTNINTLLDNASETHNTSIVISSAITAYARIIMSQFKNNPNFNLYYTDTDSAYIDKPLPKDMISNTILGKIKLENTCVEAIFLSPKMYCLKTEDGQIIYKVKGLSHDIQLTINDFNVLLYKESLLEKTQTKWFKKLSKGHVEVLDQLYTLQVTDNKRKLIYDENNKLININPYIINEDQEILL